jgi:hypothetical protein
VKAQLNSQGEFGITIPRAGLPALSLFLTLDLLNDDSLYVSASLDDGATWLTTGVTPGVVPGGLGAKYTAYFVPTAFAPQLPQGFGYLTATHDGHGGFRVVGALSDGTPFSTGTNIDGNGQLPIFAALEVNGSFLGGALDLDSDLTPTGSGIGGTLYWKHRSNPAALVFTAPFTTDLQVTGERYVGPAGGKLVSPLVVNAQTFFTADEFDSVGDVFSLANVSFTLGAGYKVLASDSPATKLTLTVTATTGRFTGSFVDGEVAKKHTINGVFVAGQGGSGFFHDAVKNGPVTVAQ